MAGNGFDVGFPMKSIEEGGTPTLEKMHACMQAMQMGPKHVGWWGSDRREPNLRFGAIQAAQPAAGLALAELGPKSHAGGGGKGVPRLPVLRLIRVPCIFCKNFTSRANSEV